MTEDNPSDCEGKPFITALSIPNDYKWGQASSICTVCLQIETTLDLRDPFGNFQTVLKAIKEQSAATTTDLERTGKAGQGFVLNFGLTSSFLGTTHITQYTTSEGSDPRTPVGTHCG